MILRRHGGQAIGLDLNLFLHRRPDVSDAAVEAYVRPPVERAAFALSTNEAWALLASAALLGLLLIPFAGPLPKREGVETDERSQGPVISTPNPSTIARSPPARSS
jgi:DHA2 family multidrug resistance protein